MYICCFSMFFQSCFIAISQHAAKFQGVHTKRQKGEKWIWLPQEVYLDKPSQEKYTGCVRPYIYIVDSVWMQCLQDLDLFGIRKGVEMAIYRGLNIPWPTNPSGCLKQLQDLKQKK